MKRRGNVDICPLASRSNHVTLLSQLALPHADALNKGLLKFWPRADLFCSTHNSEYLCKRQEQLGPIVPVAPRSEETLLLREIGDRKLWNVNFT